MRYHLAVIVETGGIWTEAFGSTSKSDVDYEVAEWVYNGASRKGVHCKTFNHVPTQAEVEAFAHQF